MQMLKIVMIHSDFGRSKFDQIWPIFYSVVDLVVCYILCNQHEQILIPPCPSGSKK